MKSIVGLWLTSYSSAGPALNPGSPVLRERQKCGQSSLNKKAYVWLEYTNYKTRETWVFEFSTRSFIGSMMVRVGAVLSSLKNVGLCVVVMLWKFGISLINECKFYYFKTQLIEQAINNKIKNYIHKETDQFIGSLAAT